MNTLAPLARRVGRIVGSTKRQEQNGRWLVARIVLVVLLATAAVVLVGLPVFSMVANYERVPASPVVAPDTQSGDAARFTRDRGEIVPFAAAAGLMPAAELLLIVLLSTVIMPWALLSPRRLKMPPPANVVVLPSIIWLGKLNEFGGDYVKAEMVKAFIDSSEYRARFGP